MTDNPKRFLKKEYASEVHDHLIDATYFYFRGKNNDTDALTIHCGGLEHCANNFHIKRDDFPFYAAIFTANGKGSYIINGKTFPLTYGSLSLLVPNTDFQLIADTSFPMQQYFLIFSGQGADELASQSNMKNLLSVKTIYPQAMLSNFKQTLRIGLDSSKNAHDICCGYLQVILLEQAGLNENLNIQSPSYENFQRCKNHLENNFIRINSSSQLASECNLNIRYIARLFRQYMQIRPHDYLVNLKMNKAANLLITTNFNIKQIAYMTGFNDQYYFSKIFKKNFKASPTEYRTKILS